MKFLWKRKEQISNIITFIEELLNSYRCGGDNVVTNAG
jgi:hypothetical protein